MERRNKPSGTAFELARLCRAPGKTDDDLFRLYEDVINSDPVNLLGGQGNGRVTLLLHTWGEKSPERCGRILHSLLEAWFVLNPGRNLFEGDELKAIDVHSLASLAEQAPEAFLQGTTDALLRSVDMVVAEGETGKNWYHFASRTFSGDRFGFDEFLGIYRAALKKIVQEAPLTGMCHLEKIDPHRHSCLMHLHLESIQANPADFANRLPALVADRLVFDAGWHGADWLSFACACREALPYLDYENRRVVEQAIFAHTPELDMAIHVLHRIRREGETQPWLSRKSVIYDLSLSGYEQWCILETIGEELLTTAA